MAITSICVFLPFTSVEKVTGFNITTAQIYYLSQTPPPRLALRDQITGLYIVPVSICTR